MSKKKNKFKIIDLSLRKDENAKNLLATIMEEVKDVPLKGIISVVIPAKGRPLLYMNLPPEEGFLHTYRATNLIANMITASEEEDEYGNENE